MVRKGGQEIKILYTSHYEPDAGEGFLWLGLTELLGCENIIDFPRKAMYHGETEQRWGYQSPAPYYPAIAQPDYTVHDIVDMIDSFDLVICSSPRAQAVRALLELHRLCGDKLPPLVVCDHQDESNWTMPPCPESIYNCLPPLGGNFNEWNENRGVFYLNTLEYYNLTKRLGAKLFFKRELLPEWRLPDVYPLPMSFPMAAFSYVPAVKWEDRTKTISGIFGNTWHTRREICDILKEVTIDGVINCTTGSHDYDYKGHLEHLASVQAGLVLRGWGIDTYRHYEVPACGTAMFRMKDALIRPNDFTDGRNAIICETADQLITDLKFYFMHPDELKVIAEEGKAHLLQYHTSVARAAYFLDIIDRKGFGRREATISKTIA